MSGRFSHDDSVPPSPDADRRNDGNLGAGGDWAHQAAGIVNVLVPDEDIELCRRISLCSVAWRFEGDALHGSDLESIEQ
jgi:hypothetical protein